MEFQDMFPTDQACFEYLCLVRWPDGFWALSTLSVPRSLGIEEVLYCVAKNCRRDVSVTAGTIFQDRHMPLRGHFSSHVVRSICQKQRVSSLGFAGHS